MIVPKHIKCSADFSDDKQGPDGRGMYRYSLWRRNLLDDDPGAFKLYEKDFIQYICVNPSTADEREDDRTVQACWKRTREMGYGAFMMTNLFAFRATDPRDMRAAREPIGELNDLVLLEAAETAGMVVLAWGSNGEHRGRDVAVLKLLEPFLDKLYYLDITDVGFCPRHPLYQRGEIRPKPVGSLFRNFLHKSHI